MKVFHNNKKHNFGLIVAIQLNQLPNNKQSKSHNQPPKGTICPIDLLLLPLERNDLIIPTDLEAILEADQNNYLSNSCSDMIPLKDYIKNEEIPSLPLPPFEDEHLSSNDDIEPFLFID